MTGGRLGFDRVSQLPLRTMIREDESEAARAGRLIESMAVDEVDFGMLLEVCGLEGHLAAAGRSTRIGWRLWWRPSIGYSRIAATR